MKRTLGIIVFVVVLPVLAIIFTIYVRNLQSNPIMEKVFPVIPSEVDGQRWLALFIKPGCSHCFYMMTDLAATLNEEQLTDFPIIVFSLADKDETQESMDSFSLPFPVLSAESGLVKNLSVRSTPHTFLIDISGNIRYNWKGRRSKQRLVELLTSFYSTGKIPIDQFSTEKRKSYSLQSYDAELYIKSDTMLTIFYNHFLQNQEVAVELYSIKQKGDMEIFSQYLTYWNTCGCEEDSAGFTYISLMIDLQGDSLLDKRVGEGLSYNDINQIKKNITYKFYGIKD